jgi:hypothetical protein
MLDFDATGFSNALPDLGFGPEGLTGVSPEVLLGAGFVGASGTLAARWLRNRHMLAQEWASKGAVHDKGTLLVVAIGTFGAAEAVRLAEALRAAGAHGEMLGILLADFHQEVNGYKTTLGRIIGADHVFAPSALPEGTSQGFMHRVQHDYWTRKVWIEQLHGMLWEMQARDNSGGNGIGTVLYLLPPWSGHLDVARYLAKELREFFPPTTLHIGRLNLPARAAVDLQMNWRSDLERATEANSLPYPYDLGLDSILLSEEDLDPSRELHDRAIATGLAGVFAASRVDPLQQHGGNLLHSLVEFARPSRGLIGIGAARGTSLLMPKLLGQFLLRGSWAWGLPRLLARHDLNELRLPRQVCALIQRAIQRKAWDAPPPSEWGPQLLSIVVPLDREHPLWRNRRDPGSARLRVDVVQALDEGIADTCTTVWTAAALDMGRPDLASMWALWLYPVTEPVELQPISPHANGHASRGEVEHSSMVAMRARS